MKKVLFIFCFLTLCVWETTAQDEKITVSESDYIGKVEKIKRLEDSIQKLNKKFEECQTNNKKLDEDLTKANKKVGRLSALDTTNKNLKRTNNSLKDEIGKKNDTIRLKNDLLHQKDNTISELQNQLNDQKLQSENQLNAERLKCASDMEQAKKNGESEIRKKIEKVYLNKEFETLIAISTLETVKHGLQLVENEKVKNTLSQLEVYFSIKESLNRPFDENNNNVNLQHLGTMPKAISVEKLKSALESYKDCVVGLQQCLDEIMELDRAVVAENSNPKQRSAKLNKISGLLSNYILNYDAMDYPYLSDIIWGVLRIKYNDVNADIENFREKL